MGPVGSIGETGPQGEKGSPVNSYHNSYVAELPQSPWLIGVGNCLFQDNH